MYATKQDMINRYGLAEMIEVTDRANPMTGEIDDDVLNAALLDASAIIDSYVSRRYDLPLDQVPVVLNGHCMTMAWYKLQRGRHTDEARTDYTDALDFLRQISTGVALLDVAGTEPASAPAQVASTSSGRTFSRGKKDGWF